MHCYHHQTDLRKRPDGLPNMTPMRVCCKCQQKWGLEEHYSHNGCQQYWKWEKINENRN